MEIRKTAWQIIFVMCFTLFCMQCNVGLNAQPNQYNIIPYPAQLDTLQGHFTISDNTILCSQNTTAEIKSCWAFFNSYINAIGGTSLKVGERSDYASDCIVYFLDNSIKHKEGYKINVMPDKVEIYSKTNAGLFYALQTLRQLMGSKTQKVTTTPITIPCCKITDSPRFEYRGMHLDVARHMFPLEFVKKYIDLMAFYKYNNFHWHLTDDQGWRAEIKKYPLLTQVGGMRKETTTNISRDKEPVTIKESYGGFYTQDQMKEVVAYAAARHINVIPEIEMPGHSLAALSAYSYLGCENKPIEVGTRWGVFEDVFCPRDTTFSFLQDVLTEIMQIFPSQYIHIGGDECPKEAWKKSDFCQQLMKRENLKDEMELQSYFVRRIEKFLNANGRQLIGWDEILEGGISPNATIMSWRGTAGGIEAARQKHDVIMTPGSHCYFDHYQYVRASEPYAIGGFSPVEKVYSFEPIPSELNAEEGKFILGAQANLWTEYIDTSTYAEYMAYPRACALAEVLWTPKDKRNYDSFLNRLADNFLHLDAMDVNYAKHVLGVYGKMVRNDDGGLYYELDSKNRDAQIKFSINDRDLNTTKDYKAPIFINQSCAISAATFAGNKRLSDVYTEQITYHNGAGAKVLMMSPWHENYNPGSSAAIVNAIQGSNNYGDGQWFGYSGNDCEVIIDLQKVQSINTLKTNFIEKNNSWIYAPSQVQFFAGNDTAKMEMVFETKPTGGQVINTIVTPALNTSARYIKMVMKNYGIIPSGNDGAGNKAWMFVDEILVD